MDYLEGRMSSEEKISEKLKHAFHMKRSASKDDITNFDGDLLDEASNEDKQNESKGKGRKSKSIFKRAGKFLRSLSRDNLNDTKNVNIDIAVQDADDYEENPAINVQTKKEKRARKKSSSDEVQDIGFATAFCNDADKDEDVPVPLFRRVSLIPPDDYDDDCLSVSFNGRSMSAWSDDGRSYDATERKASLSSCSIYSGVMSANLALEPDSAKSPKRRRSLAQLFHKEKRPSDGNVKKTAGFVLLANKWKSTVKRKSIGSTEVSDFENPVSDSDSEGEVFTQKRRNSESVGNRKTLFLHESMSPFGNFSDIDNDKCGQCLEKSLTTHSEKTSENDTDKKDDIKTAINRIKVSDIVYESFEESSRSSCDDNNPHIDRRHDVTTLQFLTAADAESHDESQSMQEDMMKAEEDVEEPRYRHPQ